MSSARMMIGAMLVVLAAPAIAQAPQTDTARQRAVNAVEAPATAQLNTDVRAAAAARDAEAAQNAEINAAQQEQYAADMAAYRSKVVENRITVAQDEHRYVRQQRAYADAMAAWRVQARECQKGKRAACNAPPPDPANFY